MRSEVSSLTFKPTPLLRHQPGSRKPPAAANYVFIRTPAAAAAAFCSKSSIGASDDRGRPPLRTLGSPEPPWLVLPPSPPENPFSGDAWLPEIQVKVAGGTGIPLSMRMVQIKKRLATAAPRWTASPPPAAEGDPAGAVEVPTGRAVWALVYMIGELQRSVLAGGDGVAVDESVLDRISRDRRDSFVWLFRRVFFSSPNLVVSLLVLLANYVAFSAEENSVGTKTAATTTADTNDAEKSAGSVSESSELKAYLLESTPESVRTGIYLNWFDIGIKEGNLDATQHEDEETCVDRRRRVYERAIAEGGVNSLILSNYAEFLYRVAKDHDRAEQYFQWAVMAEPRDAEAISRYAFFLWEKRGDISGAEEMFLEAMEVEPGNHYYSSNYAWFLWKTGALDTCYPLDPPPPLRDL